VALYRLGKRFLLRKTFLVNAGMTEKTHPMFFAFFVTYSREIALLSYFIVLCWTMASL